MTDKKDSRFTIDSEKDGEDVPTLTSLLYKKNVVKTQGSPSTRAAPPHKTDYSSMVTLEPTVTIERPMPSQVESQPSEISLASPILAEPIPEIPAHQSGVGSGLKTRPATPFQPQKVTKPVTAQSYPAGAFAASGLTPLFQKPKITSAIVFDGQDGTTYLMSSILQTPGTTSRTRFWNGMVFSPESFTDLWSAIGKNGFAEFSNLGAAGATGVDRLAIRKAFQVKSNEFLTFVKVKELSGKEGMIAFITEASIQSLLPTFHSDVLGSAKNDGLISLAA